MRTIFSRTGFAPLAEALGDARVLILCGPNRRFVDRACAVLPGARVFDGARVHVPAEVVDAVDVGDADALVAIGGGSPIGLGKALRARGFAGQFAAVPTTYAGSERTSLYGITSGREKVTKRDPRVVPDIVHYDIELACELPVVLSVQSLLNAYAHVASARSTGSDVGDDAIAGAREVLAAASGIIDAPRDLDHRERAARGASACAMAVERGKLGVQHALAHLLGGALGVDHAPLHSILLPHFLASIGEDPMPVRALLVRAGAPTTLRAIGATESQVRDALATRPELPAELALAAL